LFVDKIIRSAERLADHPRLGRSIPEIADAELRELIFQNYRIVYWTRGDEVVVLGVLHSALDFERVATERGWYLP
jgi:plasmid stabilization system protein ParE